MRAVLIFTRATPPSMSTSEIAEVFRLRVSGMTCGGCVSSVKKALEAVPGVDEAEVTLEPGSATVRASAQSHGEPLSAESLIAAVTRAGYEAELGEISATEVCEIQSTESGDSTNSSSDLSEDLAPAPALEPALESTDLMFQIGGMTCASCVSKVEAALSNVPGVEEARVNFATHRATVRFSVATDLHRGTDPQLLGADVIQAVVGAVADAGYEAEVIAGGEAEDLGKVFEKERARQEIEVRGWRNQTFAAGAVGVVLMFPGPLAPFYWLHAILGTAVQAGAGLRFYKGAWRGLKARTTNMDTLIAMSTTTAWAYGVYLLLLTELSPRHEFMTAVMLLAFIGLGKWLEGRGRLRAGQALRALLELAPATAHKVQGDGDGTKTVDVPSKDLMPGDICRVFQGERVPADGSLLEGAAEIDEAMLTGESVPVVKAPGDPIFGGTVNLTGALTLSVEKVGSATALNQIARRVDKAQNTRPKIQALADRVAGVFIPVVIVIAAVTLALSLGFGLSAGESIGRAIAVLIVACPCAIGLATPLAIMAGVGVAARQGMIVRSAETLEASRDLSVIAFDKTGTLTEGKPEVTAMVPAPGYDEEKLLRIAASLERESTHPLAMAIVRRADESGISSGNGLETFSGLEAVIGGGVKSSSPAYVLGSVEFLKSQGVRFETLGEVLASKEAEGHTLIGVGIPDGELIGGIALADQIKDGAAEAIAELSALGLKTILISGDSELATAGVARRVGLDEYRARVSPGEKADAVRALQEGGAKVAMVGDGINDAPALAQADLGIAMASGSDIAQEAAGLVLLRGDPRQVGQAIRMARAIRAKMIQNLGWAFIYNLILIPVAAFGFLQPMYASAAMAASSVSVVTNALLLYRRKLE